MQLESSYKISTRKSQTILLRRIKIKKYMRNKKHAVSSKSTKIWRERAEK